MVGNVGADRSDGGSELLPAETGESEGPRAGGAVQPAPGTEDEDRQRRSAARVGLREQRGGRRRAQDRPARHDRQPPSACQR